MSNKQKCSRNFTNPKFYRFVAIRGVRFRSVIGALHNYSRRLNALYVGETGASWSENCIFPMSDFNANLLLLV